MAVKSRSADDETLNPAMGAFVDALTAYAIDPTRWPELLAQLDSLSNHLESWDPGALVSEISRAESLSWRIKDGVDPGQSGFAYVLLNARNRAVGSSASLAALADYLTISGNGSLAFTDPASETSLDAARAALGTSHGGHSLIALSHPARPRNRFGFLISRSEFPRSLAEVAEDATHALFIAQDDASPRLEQVVQASLGLTTAEVDVTMRLAQGLTLKDAAEELSISVNTARNHLQSVFDKSGINRQSDLVLVVTQLSVILAGTESDAAIVRRRHHRSSPRHFNILRSRSSEQTNARLIYSVYGSVDHDRALLDARPDILQHMITYTLESVTVTAAGVAGELKCFARARTPALPKLDMPVTAWHGTADNLSAAEDLESYLAGQVVRWRRFPDAGSLILHEHWPRALETLAGAETAWTET